MDVDSLEGERDALWLNRFVCWVDLNAVNWTDRLVHFAYPQPK